MIVVERVEAVAVLKLARGVTNAINLELIEALRGTLSGVRDDPEVRGVVLTTSSEKFLSIGFDIPDLVDRPRVEFEHFFWAFNQCCLELYTLPKPTVAAITAHATAGGCILALCCDYRLIGEGRRLMGLNEVKLGVPVPYLPDRILDQLVGSRAARAIVESGSFYGPDEALAIGMVDQVVPTEAVLSMAVEKAAALGAMPQPGYREIKRTRVQGVAALFEERDQDTARTFVECWYSDDVRARLRAAMAKF
jgi:enoyl-CoA hydratase/carnithine racemase